MCVFLERKGFSSWIPMATDSPRICRSAGDFRVLYTDLFFMQSCPGHFYISSLSWFPSRQWFCPSLCTHLKLEKCTWPEATSEESKNISSLSNGKIISYEMILHIDFPLARSTHCWNHTHMSCLLHLLWLRGSNINRKAEKWICDLGNLRVGKN